MVMAWRLERGGSAVVRTAESVGFKASGQMAKAEGHLAPNDEA